LAIKKRKKYQKILKMNCINDVVHKTFLYKTSFEALSSEKDNFYDLEALDVHENKIKFS